MNTVTRTATMRQTSDAGKNEPTMSKEGARTQLVCSNGASTIPCFAKRLPRPALMVWASGRRIESHRQSGKLDLRRLKGPAYAPERGVEGDREGVSRRATREDRSRVSEHEPRSLLTAPLVAEIDHVVVEQGRAVDELDRDRELEGAAIEARSEPGRERDQQRAKPLSAALTRSRTSSATRSSPSSRRRPRRTARASR